MPDEKPPMPPQPTTVALEKVPAWAIALKESVDGGIKLLRADIECVATDLTVVKDRVVILETWRNQSDERLSRASGGARQISMNDAKQDQRIDQLVEKVDTLDRKTDAQTAMLTEAKDAAAKLIANPIIRSILTMLGTAVLTWLAAHGGRP